MLWNNNNQGKEDIDSEQAWKKLDGEKLRVAGEKGKGIQLYFN